MCLIKDMAATNVFLKKYEGQETVVVWKRYTVLNSLGRVFPPYLHRSGGDEVFAGVIKSNRRRKFNDKEDKCDGTWWNRDTINRGIHVFVTRKAARNSRVGSKIFKCTALLKDLVGVNRHNECAVFMKINITPEEFEKGKKGRN